MLFTFKLLNRCIPVFKLVNIAVITTDKIFKLFVNMLLFCQYNAIIQDQVSYLHAIVLYNAIAQEQMS